MTPVRPRSRRPKNGFWPLISSQHGSAWCAECIIDLSAFEASGVTIEKQTGPDAESSWEERSPISLRRNRSMPRATAAACNIGSIPCAVDGLAAASSAAPANPANRRFENDDKCELVVTMIGRRHKARLGEEEMSPTNLRRRRMVRSFVVSLDSSGSLSLAFGMLRYWVDHPASDSGSPMAMVR